MLKDYERTVCNEVGCSFIRPISEEELKHLREHHYTAISDKQRLIDQKLQVEVRICLKRASSHLHRDLSLLD